MNNATNPHTQNNPILFNFRDKQIRIIDRNGEVWFVAKDVCRILELDNHRMAVDKLDQDEKGVTLIDSLGGQQEMVIVNESGFYTLVLRCRRATTPGMVQHIFRKWVTSEVLPSIRKTGRYQLPTPPQAIDLPDQVFPFCQLDFIDRPFTIRMKNGVPTINTIDIAENIMIRHDMVMTFLIFYEKSYGGVGHGIRETVVYKDKKLSYTAYTEIAHLTERQAISILSVATNNEKVRHFRFKLLEAFAEVEAKIQQKRLLLTESVVPSLSCAQQ